MHRPHALDRLRRAFVRALPSTFVFGDDQLTLSARLFFGRLAVAAAAALLGIAGIVLLSGTDWHGVLSGALLAWAVSAVLWARNSYGHHRQVVREDLRHQVELDLLHARLNHLANRVGAPTVGLTWRIREIIEAREERLAHLSGIEEFRGSAPPEGYTFWDEVALSDPDL